MKAFDSIGHQSLLQNYQIGGKFFDVISSMHSNSKCCVRAQTTRSDFLITERSSTRMYSFTKTFEVIYKVPETLSINALDPNVLPDGD